MPFHGAIALRKDFVEERYPCKDAWRFTVESCVAWRVADYEAAVVEAGRVFVEPGGDLRFEVYGEEVCRVAVCDCHFEGDFGGVDDGVWWDEIDAIFIRHAFSVGFYGGVARPRVWSLAWHLALVTPTSLNHACNTYQTKAHERP